MPEVVIHVALHRVRQRPQRDLVRHAVVEPVGTGLVRSSCSRGTRGVVHADLERVRAGDVRHVEAPVEVVVPRVVVGAAPRVPVVQVGDDSAVPGTLAP